MASSASHPGSKTVVIYGGASDDNDLLGLGDTWAWDGSLWRRDNQPLAGPVVAVGDATVSEGNAGTRNAVFTVSWSKPSASTVTVDYATRDRSAVAVPQEGPFGDYLAKAGTLSFAPGITALTVKVPVNGDFNSPAGGNENAEKEIFTFNLSGATGATIGDHQGLGTILNDEPVTGLFLAIGDATVYEGNAGSRAAVFNVSLSAPSPNQITVAYKTVMDTTKANDLTSVNGTVTFPPGTTTRGIKVPITADTRVEPDESFTLRLFDATRGVTLHRGVGTGTVLGDDM